jgi:CDP-diacylglycerol--serine O-phosphatidyltransferase
VRVPVSRDLCRHKIFRTPDPRFSDKLKLSIAGFSAEQTRHLIGDFMGVPAQNEESGLEPQRRRLGRGVFILPSVFTVGNIFLGYYAIIATMRGDFDRAALAIGFAIILDMLDGRVARLTNTATSFGLQLDSLADVISFGVAPSILALVWGLGPVNHRLGWISAFTFTICGAMRLARFNVQAGKLKHFVGLPIPAAGGAIAAIVHFFPEKVGDMLLSSIMTGVVFALALLMVSTLRYNSLKQLTLGKKSHLTILVMALLVALIYNFSRWTLLTIALSYSISGPAHKLLTLLRRRRPAGETHLPETVEE